MPSHSYSHMQFLLQICMLYSAVPLVPSAWRSLSYSPSRLVLIPSPKHLQWPVRFSRNTKTCYRDIASAFFIRYSGKPVCPSSVHPEQEPWRNIHAMRFSSSFQHQTPQRAAHTQPCNSYSLSISLKFGFLPVYPLQGAHASHIHYDFLGMLWQGRVANGTDPELRYLGSDLVPAAYGRDISGQASLPSHALPFSSVKWRFKKSTGLIMRTKWDKV